MLMNWASLPRPLQCVHCSVGPMGNIRRPVPPHVLHVTPKMTLLRSLCLPSQILHVTHLYCDLVFSGEVSIVILTNISPIESILKDLLFIIFQFKIRPGVFFVHIDSVLLCRGALKFHP
jgi:hypothetical protein